jgi:hypothetical protein
MPRGMIAGSYESIYRGSFMSFLILISLSIYSYLITLADIVTFNHVKDSWYLCLSVNTSRVFLSSKILTLGFIHFIKLRKHPSTYISSIPSCC